MKIDMRKEQGFTLIELMIVVAIIGILAAIAIPQYQNYVIRSQVSEGINLAGGQKTAVAEYYSNRGTLPTNNSMAGIPSKGSINGKYVTQVKINGSGAIVAKFGGNKVNSSINNGTIELSPYHKTGSNLNWTCKAGGSKIKNSYLPTSCHS